MNNKVSIDFEVIKLLYFKYRAYIFPILGISISWALIFMFVIPQFQIFLATKDQVAASEQTLASLTQNYNTLITINDSDLKSQSSIVNKALPKEKDFAGILNAISFTSAASGATLQDYSFQLGQLNGSGTFNGNTTQISLVIKGDLNLAKSFMITLSNTLPISEVTSFNESSGQTASIVANFFSTPTSNINFVDTNPLPILSSDQKNLLSKLMQNTH